MGSVFTWSQKFWIADQSCSDTLGSVALSVKEIKIKDEKKYTHTPPPQIKRQPRTVLAQLQGIRPSKQTAERDRTASGTCYGLREDLLTEQTSKLCPAGDSPSSAAVGPCAPPSCPIGTSPLGRCSEDEGDSIREATSNFLSSVMVRLEHTTRL